MIKNETHEKTKTKPPKHHSNRNTSHNHHSNHRNHIHVINMKKENTPAIYLGAGIIIIILIIGTALLFLNPQTAEALPNDETPNTPPTTEPTEDTQTPCDYIHEEYPREASYLESSCSLAGGVPVYTTEECGCYYLTGFNTTYCTTPELETFRMICESGEWDFTCNSREISCEK